MFLTTVVTSLPLPNLFPCPPNYSLSGSLHCSFQQLKIQLIHTHFLHWKVHALPPSYLVLIHTLYPIYQCKKQKLHIRTTQKKDNKTGPALLRQHISPWLINLLMTIMAVT